MYIKGFDENLQCRNDYQFEIGKEYKIAKNEELKLCSNTVFHFCDSLQKVDEYYRADSDNNRFCEIEVLGEIVSDNEKMGSNHIKIMREIVGEELEILKGHINNNSGLFNSGNRNSGDWNSGDRNSGDWNSGYGNSGNSNSGDRNSGDWNSGNWNSGVFNNTQSKIRMFNNESDCTFNDWRNSNACKIMNTMPQKIRKTVFKEESEMTNKEKEGHPEYKTIGGYLKVYSDNVNVQEWWDKLSDSDKADVMALPNFDKTVFKEITGIEV